MTGLFSPQQNTSNAVTCLSRVGKGVDLFRTDTEVFKEVCLDSGNRLSTLKDRQRLTVQEHHFISFPTQRLFTFDTKTHINNSQQ